MKAQLYTPAGEKKSEVTLPAVFDTVVREDIALKYFEAEKFQLRQRYSSHDEAGKHHSASGLASHRRHKWKTQYGKGMARVPQKIMSRRGTQFYWVGAETSQTRGGRSIHHPVGLYTVRKTNRKEKLLAINTGIAATASAILIKQRYSTINAVNFAPAVIESVPAKTKLVLAMMEKIFGQDFNKVFKNKVVRAGKGKRRARKYKSNAGLLLVIGKDEKVSVSGLDVRKVSEIRMKDLYPLGRITLYTQKAITDLGGKNAA